MHPNRYKLLVNRIVTSVLCLNVFLFAESGLALKKLPPIKSPQDAMMQLNLKGESRQLAALDNLKKACSGRYRRALKDAPAIIGPLTKFSKAATIEVKKATMDAFRCFSPDKFARLLQIQIKDADPAVVSYAAEVSARVSDAAVLPALIGEWKRKADQCLKPGLDENETKRCVWLTYAPGASAANSDQGTKETLAKLAVKQFASPYAKVREVAVETLSATKLAAHAASLKKLIEQEKSGHFKQGNDSALLGRFEKRYKTLKRSK